MIAFRSVLFYLFFSIGVLGLAVILFLLPSLNRKKTYVSNSFTSLSHFLFKHLIGLDIQIEGQEYMPQGAAIIISNHQSYLETFLLFRIFKDPVMIFKKELLRVPIFGYFLKKAGMIAIDRKNASQSFREMMSEIHQRLDVENRPVCIFPEGTRCPPGRPGKFKRGIGLIANQVKVPIVYVVHNSGEFCKGWKILPGLITFQILPPQVFEKDLIIQKMEDLIHRNVKNLSGIGE
jgi:1-acyl-sn-glycerol-3-phosphate acyltransferase